MDESVYKDVELAYRDRFSEYGDTPKGVYWNDKETQELRFERLCRSLFLEPRDTAPVIHDVGCGTGALHEYFIANAVEHRYVGTEMVAEMADVCRTKIPSGTIHTGNFLEQDTGQFDFVVSSGSCNFRGHVEPQAWHRNTLALFDRMYDRATRAIAFNFLTAHTTVPPDPTLHYLDPAEIYEYCRSNMSRFVVLDQSYPLFEVTITVYRPEYVQGVFSSSSFAKYFGPTSETR